MTEVLNRNRPVVLTIAGSDSGGGAGIQADLLTFSACGVFGTSAITCITAQNPSAVTKVEVMSAELVTAQLEAVSSYFRLGAIKTGMLFTVEIIEAVGAFVAAHPEVPLVVDPVMVATSGAVLLRDDARVAVRKLLARATVHTPNLDEAAVLLGWLPDSEEGMLRAAEELVALSGRAVLLKGGHLPGDELVDVLTTPAGTSRTMRRRRIEGVNTHGSGCTLASALAAGLAKGEDLTVAVDSALSYVAEGMRQSINIAGESFIAH